MDEPSLEHIAARRVLVELIEDSSLDASDRLEAVRMLLNDRTGNDAVEHLAAIRDELRAVRALLGKQGPTAS